MSKGNSHLFSGTSGEGQALIDEVVANGDKISPDKVLMITRDPSGKIVWMEEGNSSSGLQHIVGRGKVRSHGHDMNVQKFLPDTADQLPAKSAALGVDYHYDCFLFHFCISCSCFSDHATERCICTSLTRLKLFTSVLSRYYIYFVLFLH